MNRFKIILLFFLLGWLPVTGQTVPEVNFSQFEPWLKKNNDTTYVINFWATWCKPCVEELPGFLKAAADLKNEKVKFIFVSLDFPTQKESRLLPFIEEHAMNEQVILLNDPASNQWIPKVDPQWSGAIPATLIYKGKNKRFHEGSLSYDELITIIKSK
ncbi:TlpA family protein disulfide reductase [Thermophagus xiamenensis]|uniref:AhpC/TSA family protein n=1 Tax=Thermophagus xiamenensis TaxID=385682 RepID=A0A1I2DTR7_9BACT|nr:TlpA disulfide reductase family protein [Thermophagus xiamenensis]SFE83965.1 AhpC/TSA family protein [Thermophagus xiamenensis]